MVNQVMEITESRPLLRGQSETPLDHCTFKNAPVGQLRFLKVQWSEVEFGEEEGVSEGLALTSQIPDLNPQVVSLRWS
jgi:hypothetical protein